MFWLVWGLIYVRNDCISIFLSEFTIKSCKKRTVASSQTVCPHVTNRIPLDAFSWYFVLESFYINLCFSFHHNRYPGSTGFSYHIFVSLLIFKLLSIGFSWNFISKSLPVIWNRDFYKRFLAVAVRGWRLEITMASQSVGYWLGVEFCGFPQSL
jgi:hypothetical protein